MNNHEKYQMTFSALTPEFSAEEIRGRAESEKRQVNLKRLWIPAVAAAILLCLTVTASALGLTENWLRVFLRNTEEHPELVGCWVDGASITVDGVTYSIDHVLSEGKILYWQMTVRAPDGTSVENLDWDTLNEYELKGTDRNGNPLSFGWALSMRRLDDGTNPSNFVLAASAEIETTGFEDLSGGKLTLTYKLGTPLDGDRGLGGVSYTPAVEVTTTVQPYELREAVLTGGYPIRIGRVSIEIQGLEFLGDWSDPEKMDLLDPIYVVLKDGTEIETFPAICMDTSFPLSEQSFIASLPEIIEPEDVTAIRYGEAVYEVLGD